MRPHWCLQVGLSLYKHHAHSIISHSYTSRSSDNITSCTPVQQGNKVSIYSTATSLLFLPYALEVEDRQQEVNTTQYTSQH